MIFQYPVVALGAAVATDITQAAGVYCEYVSKPYFAKLWVSLRRAKIVPYPSLTFDYTDKLDSYRIPRFCRHGRIQFLQGPQTIYQTA
jgi:hypothetical protein